jgi:hypothetical protein
MTTDERTARQELIAYLKVKLSTGQPIKLPTVVDEATDHFSRDAAFLRRFAATMLRQVIYEVAVATIGTLRHPVNVRPGRAAVPTSEVAAGVWGRWETQLEHVGDMYVPLLDLTKETGRVAVAERRKRADAEERMASLIERLISPLRRNQTIRGYWKPQEVERLVTALQPATEAA